MEKSSAVVFMFCSLVIGMAYAYDHSQEYIAFQNIYFGREKIVSDSLQVYVHDVLDGPNPTVWPVAQSNRTSNSSTGFGLVRVVDDLVTAGPDRNSEKVGRVQGLVTNSDMEVLALTMNINFVFTSGKYNGSTLCILGRNVGGNKYVELPIVGGTGVFRMARGYAMRTIYFYDQTSGGVLEFNLYVAYVKAHSSASQ